MTVRHQHENGAVAAVLPDGKRWHLQHGPIDLVVQAFGEQEQVAAAHAAAWEAFPHILPGLVGELATLRQPLDTASSPPMDGAAARMIAACEPHLPEFVTPMAAVAGAVADEVLAAMVSHATLDRAFVNNGGDIALWLSEGASLAAGVVTDQDHPALDAFTEITWQSPVRGIATSGWKGRSQSLGIADSVTVLAGTAAAADVAATLIGNAVDVSHPAVTRQSARDLDVDTDLGERLVTVAVGRLPQDAIEQALGGGLAAAQTMQAAGLIEGALLTLQGVLWSVGDTGVQPLLAAE